MSPYESMNGRKPTISFLHVFRCRCFIKNNRDQLTKFQPKADEAILLGYSLKSKAYRVLKWRTRLLEESFDVTFDDNFVRNSGPTHITTQIMESDAPLPGCMNPQTILEVDFETLFGPSKTALDSESRSRPSLIPIPASESPISQNVSGPLPSLPPFDSEPFQPSQVEGENAHPSLESHADGFQDATADFDDSNPLNNDENENFLSSLLMMMSISLV